MKTSTPKYLLFIFCLFFTINLVSAQMIRIPDGGVNLKSVAGRRVGVTDIEINWNAPGVKGREGNIWGTSVAPYGFTVLGYGSYMESPWRAGSNESTTISFSTDVSINGKPLAAGTYGFFIALYADSCTLIFNKNTKGWGSYFYNKELDVLHVTTRQRKNQPESVERLTYHFIDQTDHSVTVALDWEHWRIPINVEVDLVKTTLASIRQQLSGAMGFDPPSLETAAAWCLQNNTNYDQALSWINVVTDPNLGRIQTFTALSTKAGLLNKLDRPEESAKIMQHAMDKATALEMHGYGRQLINQGKPKEAMVVFETNYKRNKGAWPTAVGMMRGYSANGDLKKALEFGKKALALAPNEESKRGVEQNIKTLESGKAL
jgi:hypothetical protein